MSSHQLLTLLRRFPWLLGAAGCMLGCGAGDSASPSPPSPQALPSPPPPTELTLRIVGENYGWRVHYAGPDGRFETADDAVSGPDFHLPTGIPVTLEVTSRDYLYLLKIPRFGVKVMAVPEMVMTAAVHIEHPAQGELSGDPMCGFQHGELTGTVTAVPWDDFVRRRDSLPGPKPD
jgi:cytochrome c oxidase subunit 2